LYKKTQKESISLVEEIIGSSDSRTTKRLSLLFPECTEKELVSKLVVLLPNEKTKNAQNAKKSKLSGGESNPGLLRVVLSNDKQKY
jgi:hypothetical protein